MLTLLEEPDLSTEAGQLDRALLETFYSSLIRLDEMTALDIDHVDLTGNQLFVAKGKGQKQRWVPLGKHACKFIEGYIRNVRGKLARRSKKKSSALWLNARGQRLSGQLIYKRVREYGESAGISKRVSPHILRHSGATELAKSGCDISIVASILGHAPCTDTQVYCRVAGVEVRKLKEKQKPLDVNVDFEAPVTWAVFK
jgi:integrase/recombinase XerD